MQIDDPYKTKYKKADTVAKNNPHFNFENTLMINEYYRDELEVSSEYDCSDIFIRKCDFFEMIYCGLKHPNPYVRMNSIIAVISLLLGFIAFFTSFK